MMMVGSGASTGGTRCGRSRKQPNQRHHNHHPGGDIAGLPHMCFGTGFAPRRRTLPPSCAKNLYFLNPLA